MATPGARDGRPPRPELHRPRPPARPARRTAAAALTRCDTYSRRPAQQASVPRARPLARERTAGDVSSPAVSERERSATPGSRGAQGLEVFERSGEALVERRPRLPAEMDRGAARVERGPAQLAGPRRFVARLTFESHQPCHRVEQLLHA